MLSILWIHKREVIKVYSQSLFTFPNNLTMFKGKYYLPGIKWPGKLNLHQWKFFGHDVKFSLLQLNRLKKVPLPLLELFTFHLELVFFYLQLSFSRTIHSSLHPQVFFGVACSSGALWQGPSDAADPGLVQGEGCTGDVVGRGGVHGNSFKYTSTPPSRDPFSCRWA